MLTEKRKKELYKKMEEIRKKMEKDDNMCRRKCTERRENTYKRIEKIKDELYG